MKLNKRILSVVVIGMLIFAVAACDKEKKAGTGSDTGSGNTTTASGDTKKAASEKGFLTDGDKDMLKKVYDELSTSEKQRFAEINGSLSKLSAKEKEEFGSEITRIAKEMASFNNKVQGDKSKDLSDSENKIYEFKPGTHSMEGDVQIPEAGFFRAVLTGNGVLTVKDRDGRIYYESSFKNGDTNHKAMIYLFDGYSFKLTDTLNAKIQLFDKVYGDEPFTIYRGIWAVPKNIKPGKYSVSYKPADVISDTAKVEVLDSNRVVTNSVDITDQAKSFEIELTESTNLKVTGVTQLNLKPIK